MIRITLASILLVASVAVAQQKPLSAIGARDSAGRPTGEYRIVNTRGDTQAKGRFVQGQLEGLWTFWDSHKTRTAEIRYHHDRPSGEYRLYYSALAYPRAAGRLNAQGQISGNHIVGEHIAYDVDGRILSRAIFGPRDAIKPLVGTAALAKKAGDADYHLFQGVDKSIRDALR